MNSRKGKDANTSGKIKGLNATSLTLIDDIPEITATKSLRSGKVLNELFSTNNSNQEK